MRLRLPARRRVRAVVASTLAVAVVAAIAGCTSQTVVVDGTEVSVATTQSVTSVNPNTSFGSATALNAAVAGATNSRFFSYDQTPELVADESFGSVEVVSEEPLTVSYRVAEGLTWSDGEPIGAADLLLSWAANSGVLNEPGFDDAPYFDESTQRYGDDFPTDVVFFDGSARGGLDRVTATPELGDDGRSITLVYDEYFVDWRLAFDLGLPAHVVAQRALGIDDPAEATDALVDAVVERDTDALAPISRLWNSGFDVAALQGDPALLTSSGPYSIVELTRGEVVLEANERYRGDHDPTYESVVIRTIADPLDTVAALDDGIVDVIAPQPTEEVIAALLEVEGIAVRTGVDSAYERIDLQYDGGRSGVFADARVREAFLNVVPRQQILDELVVPVQEEAELRSSNLFLPGAEGYDDAVAENGSEAFEETDPDAARQLLAEAGVTAPEVCVLFDPANQRRVVEFGLLQASAADAGFRVTDCSSTDWRELLGVRGAYDASLYALRSFNLAVSSARAGFASTDAVNNTSFFADPKIDALLDELDVTDDAEAQRRLLIEIDTILWADAAGLPLYQFPSLTAVSVDVTGVAPSPLAGGLLWNVWEWAPAAS